jgi:hypothetical protein
MTIFITFQVFRGHKGREAGEIERAVQQMESTVTPLTDLLRKYEEETVEKEKVCWSFFLDTVILAD